MRGAVVSNGDGGYTLPESIDRGQGKAGTCLIFEVTVHTQPNLLQAKVN
jgi:hypothetical protein